MKPYLGGREGREGGEGGRGGREGGREREREREKETNKEAFVHAAPWQVLTSTMQGRPLALSQQLNSHRLAEAVAFF